MGNQVNAQIRIGIGGGNLLDIHKPEDYEKLSLDWIIDSLANIRRFSGRGMSVLNHSYVCYKFVEHQYGLAECSVVALTHDFTEAVTGDIIAPIKNAVPGLSELDQIITNNIQQRFSLPPAPDHSHLLKMVDLFALEMEARYIVGWGDVELSDVTTTLGNYFTPSQRDLMVNLIREYDDTHGGTTVSTNKIVSVINTYHNTR